MTTDAKRVRAIRRILRKASGGRAADCLEKVAAIASGKTDPEEFMRPSPNARLKERLEAGMASVPEFYAPKPEKKEEPEKKRKEKPGRDRKERSGMMRTGDLTGGDK
jgi:hypothetical protein